MVKEALQTTGAPEAIGAYSQAIRSGATVYLSGQIPLTPGSMQLVEGINEQIQQVFENLRAVAQCAGGDLNDIVKLTVYLTDLEHFGAVNTVMAKYFDEPYPARAAIGVAALPRNAAIEIEGIMVLSQ